MMTLTECYAAVLKEIHKLPRDEQMHIREKEIERLALQMLKEDQAKAQEQSARRIRAEEAVDRAWDQAK